jgi:uncharacterized protein (TIGR02271 family)
VNVRKFCSFIAVFRVANAPTRSKRWVFGGHLLTSRGSTDKSRTGSLTIPVIEERAVLLSKPKDNGAVRVHKEVREREAPAEAVVRAEEVLIERRILDPPRPVDAPPGVRQEGNVTVVPILEERLVLTRQLVVREELRIARVERTRVARERVTLRSEEVRIDRKRVSRDATDNAEPSPKQPEESEMERVLIGVFDSKDQAENARRQLRDCGIAEDRITMRSGTRDDPASTTSTPQDEENHVGFFGRLFGRIEGHESHSPVYSEAVDRGGCVVVVDAISDDRVDEAVSVLERNGAVDIDERASKWRAEASTAPVAGTSAAPSGQMQAKSEARAQQTGGQAATRIPVVEEQLQVGKREIQRGGVRVYTRTTERPVEQDVSLREEHARVERHPVDRAATEAELGQAFEEKSVELRETAEEPVVAKTARVVEEVDVARQVSERTERVQDTVRRTDVEVEDLQGRKASATARSGAMAGRVDGIDVDDLNRLLRNELSAVETYRQALDKNRGQHGQDARFQQLADILRDHEQAAAQLRAIVRQMGGTESNDSGAWGTWANAVMGTAKLFGDKAALKSLKEGEESGIEDYESLLQDSDASSEIRNVFTSICSKEKEHVRMLDRLIDNA